MTSPIGFDGFVSIQLSNVAHLNQLFFEGTISFKTCTIFSPLERGVAAYADGVCNRLRIVTQIS